MNQVIDQNITERYSIYNGDCIDVMNDLPANSIHYSVFSPPFAELYAYSNSERDLGNAKNYDEFFVHFRYVAELLFYVLKPGRLVTVHCVDIPAMKERDGYIGLKDFPGDIIRLFQAQGFIYHSRHIIWKDPLIEATRTKALGLMYKQTLKDSAMCRAGLPDYLITMRKPGENEEPVSHKEHTGFGHYVGTDTINNHGLKYAHEVWQKYASPVWMDIRQTHTLNKMAAREEKDEKHICPLQLDTIERALVLWSKENDIVLSPFAGIGSEGYVALKLKRRFVGVELKESYYREMVKNLDAAQDESQQVLFRPAHE